MIYIPVPCLMAAKWTDVVVVAGVVILSWDVNPKTSVQGLRNDDFEMKSFEEWTKSLRCLEILWSPVVPIVWKTMYNIINQV